MQWIYLIAVIAAVGCTSPDTASSSRGIEPERHPEPTEWPEQPDAGRRDSSVGPVVENTSGLESACDTCVHTYQSPGSCGEDCYGPGRDPDQPPAAPDPCAGVEPCFGQCLCNLCGFVLLCDDTDPNHGPGSGPACEQCHFANSANGDLKFMDLFFLTDPAYRTIDDYFDSSWGGD